MGIFFLGLHVPYLSEVHAETLREWLMQGHRETLM